MGILASKGLTQKMDEKGESVQDLSQGILNSEVILNDTEETVSEILDRVRMNEDQDRMSRTEISTLLNKFDAYSLVLELLVKKMTNVENTVENLASQTQKNVTSCDEFYLRNYKVPVCSPRVTITNEDGIPLMCDTDTNGGGWTIFQKRVDSRVDFYRNWTEYENGFGSMESSFWMGLKALRSMVSTGQWELRVEVEYHGRKYYAEYSTFSIGDKSTNYALTVSGYSGTAGDSLIVSHNGKAFSTFDKDNDSHTSNCAKVYTGAWWYGSGCHQSNLNGRWGSKEHGKGVNWNSITQFEDSATFTEMKIRPVR